MRASALLCAAAAWVGGARALSGLKSPPRDLCLRLREQVDRCNFMGGVELLPLVVDGEAVGAVPAALAGDLAAAGAAFVVEGGAVALAPGLRSASAAERTAAVAATAAALRESGVVTGWRDELVAVGASFDAAPAFECERACYPLLGARGFGVHVNGIVEDFGGGDAFRIWVGRRSATKATYPGLLDHLAAGQLPAGAAPGETVVREAGEEAGVPPEIAKRAVPVGAISYRGVNGEGRGERVTTDNIFCYDLSLPAAFEPTPVDGEIDAFELMAVDDVVRLVCEGKFKPNVALVTIDLLVRRGVLSPELPGYLALVGALRRGDLA